MKISTKSQSEREDAEAKRLLERPDAKIKPPRPDKRRNQIKVDESDSKDTSGEDRDMSMKWNKVAALANVVLSALDKAALSHRPGDVWQAESGAWNAMNQSGSTKSFGKGSDAKGKAEAFANKQALPNADVKKKS